MLLFTCFQLLHDIKNKVTKNLRNENLRPQGDTPSMYTWFQPFEGIENQGGV
jgi:hypothetical protein